MIILGDSDMKKVLIAMTGSILLAACAEEPAPVETLVDIQAGKQIAEADCSGCHGLDGRGKTADIPNLAAQASDYLVEAMHAYREDRRHHAALQDLIAGFSEEDIRNIAGYFSTLPPVPPAPASAEGDAAYREGAEIAAACTGCHGESGVSTTAGIPSLAGQQPVYLIVSTQEYASGGRGHAEKEQMLEGLGEVDIEKMAMYFASQAPSLREPPPFGDAVAGEPLTAVCGSCHGARGVSHDPMVPNLAGQEPNYLVSAIKAYRDKERSHDDMVAERSDEEIENIAAFYSVQAAGSVTGGGQPLEELVATCNRCHDQASSESAIVVPALKGQKRDYLLRVMKQYRDDDRGSSMMHKMSAGYSNELLEELAGYYANQPRN
jgi:cytochrome c553